MRPGLRTVGAGPVPARRGTPRHTRSAADEPRFPRVHGSCRRPRGGGPGDEGSGEGRQSRLGSAPEASARHGLSPLTAMVRKIEHCSQVRAEDRCRPGARQWNWPVRSRTRSASRSTPRPFGGRERSCAGGPTPLPLCEDPQPCSHWSPRTPRTSARTVSSPVWARVGWGGSTWPARKGGCTVAVKPVHAEFALHPAFRRRFAREVAAARRVGGEWTAPVLDADTEVKHPWVATGYVPGPPLDKVVDGDFGPLPPASVHVLAHRLALALQAIHEEGLVHRDLKTANILLTVDGPPRHRLRPRPRLHGRPRRRPDRARDGARHSGVHVARAGARRDGDQSERPLLPRVRPHVRGDRTAPISWYPRPWRAVFRRQRYD